MMESKILRDLEYYKVVEHISNYAYTDLGKNNLLSLKPYSSKAQALYQGMLVSEAKEILIRNDIPPLTRIPDLYETISKSKIEGSILNQKQIFDILKLANTSRLLYQFLKAEETAFNIMNSFADKFFIDKAFEHGITSLFDENGNLRDSASQKLKEIRKEINSKSENLRKTVHRILKELTKAYLVQEEYTTQRDGRIVLPIKAEHKRHVKGFIHSESATGQTVYIEPEETLELNNEILSLSFAEKREIERILMRITQKIGAVSEELKEALSAISEIDSIFSKAKYSLEIIGSFPSFDEEKPFEVIDGRHPLLLRKLDREATIPLNLKIEDNRIILITGPNAGGKTVVLKTVGLLSLIAQSGIHVPLHPDSNLWFFDTILADIGDQQSIEDDLSTFSSHLSNIKDILGKAGKDSLVLLDEIGTGTDPTEGSALAVAVLIYLNKLNSAVLATTHHGSLKVIAHDLAGFENASMEFDLEKLKPTYNFQQGLPGSSYAFEVARRIGFGEDFIDLSKEYLDKDKSKLEHLLVDLENKARNYHSKLSELEIENSRLSGLTRLYEDKIKKLEEQKGDILNDAKRKAETYLEDVNKTIERAIKNIKESKAEKEVIKEEKKNIETLKDSVKEPVPQRQLKTNYKLAVGDYVRIKDTTTEGRITDIDEEKRLAVVASGSIKLKAKLASLMPVSKVKEAPAQDVNKSIYIPEVTGIKLDIRGDRPEGIEYKVLKFIDDSYATSIQKIEILHGKGTGALKTKVHEILNSHQHVKNYYFADIESGGEGITIVELK